ncbi:peptidase associated/transthyretin-like domain-containing protein [Pontibacter akesuensis]|uniref:CarboxypepD_reg-like domain-containing protein n=1 Tax=Pontibacter akesuensis TaxID=388950 RepID=A0A1I7K506_9BACT|nr:hypothetical protein [Pontibacter akesuensis]GHA75058.1 hypothetical protein GCM10007389_31110 [Pontibacter akesuensis]SFU92442.1 hypothetical protein SAMN04487941_3395 [Pontibacter akesuensis]
MPPPASIYTSLTLLLLLYVFPARAQRVQVHGVVLGSDGKTPLLGAGITNINANTVTITDAAGRFSVPAQPLDSLLVRAVGFKPVLYLVDEQAVSGKPLILILQEDSVLLQEVQVRSMPSEEEMRRILHSKAPEKRALVQRPGYNPALEPPPPPEESLPNMVLNPASYFSREGMQRRQLKKHLEAGAEKQRQAEAERIKAEEARYNSFFKDSTSNQ